MSVSKTQKDTQTQTQIYLLDKLLSLSFVEIGYIQIERRLPVNTWIKLDGLRVVLAVYNDLPLQFVGVVNILAKDPWTKRNVDICVFP